jgi:hypothetical protein
MTNLISCNRIIRFIETVIESKFNNILGMRYIMLDMHVNREDAIITVILLFPAYVTRLPLKSSEQGRKYLYLYSS